MSGDKKLPNIVVKQDKLNTKVTIEDKLFMAWKNSTNDPCLKLNIGSYTEFTFLDNEIDGMIKFLEWYKQNKKYVTVIET